MAGRFSAGKAGEGTVKRTDSNRGDLHRRHRSPCFFTNTYLKTVVMQGAFDAVVKTLLLGLPVLVSTAATVQCMHIQNFGMIFGSKNSTDCMFLSLDELFSK